MSVKKGHPLDSKVVVITGAADGIGEALARQLHKRGAKLALIDRDSTRLFDLADELGAEAMTVDVTNAQSMRIAMEYFQDSLGGIDVVVANAGIADECPIISDRSTDFLRRTLEVNVIGTHNTVMAAMPYIRQGSYILLTSSLAAAIQLPLMMPYNASKAAVEAYGNTLRVECNGLGIKVGVAHYAQLKTKMTEKFGSEAAQWILSRRMLHLIHRVAPLPPAIDAIEKGIIKQSRVVVSPWYVRYLLPLGRLLQLFVAPWAGNIQPALVISRRNQIAK